ncbi:secondary thiamine-phosphate synthase enzyme YjbQ [soil metagenome]|jgi:secondary thiamine-phosphate synthase enzyme|nr:YjbQ family protein [Actinomycetota bacterium]MDQ3217001.1 secondary thiamine-phosphate synthase enzyme YjbQ [Actinomycetota bacterium]
MKTHTLSLQTASSKFVDLTSELERFVSAARDGLLNVFVPHATAGVAVIETGSGSEEDLEQALNRLLPRNQTYVHSHGSPGHGADHVIPAFISPSVTIPVVGGALQLGTWQSVVLVDLNEDNPRRQVHLSFLAN